MVAECVASRSAAICELHDVLVHSQSAVLHMRRVLLCNNKVESR
jgi:hypothetical protein